MGNGTVRAAFAAALLLVASPVVAAPPEKGDVSVAALAGVSAPFEGDYSSGFLLELQGDYHLDGPFALRATLGYTHGGSDLPGGGDLTVNSFLAGGVYRARLGQVVVFGTLGFGYYVVEPPDGGRSGRLGVHLGGGVEVGLNVRTSLVAQGVFHLVGDVGERSSDSFGLAAGIRYRF